MGKTKDLHRMVKGRIAEMRVAAELLSRGHDVFAPLVDIKGVDLLILRANGAVDEIQVKSVQDRWFQLQTKQAPQGACRQRAWIVCVEGNGVAWVFPASVFCDPEISSVSGDAERGYTYDLNLDVTRRGRKAKSGEFLAEYKGAWHLLD